MWHRPGTTRETWISRTMRYVAQLGRIKQHPRDRPVELREEKGSPRRRRSNSWGVGSTDVRKGAAQGETPYRDKGAGPS